MRCCHVADVILFLISEEKFTLELAAAQAFTFFLGGFETSFMTIQFTMYELAQNQELPNRLRKEIKESLDENGGKINYESVHEMDLLGRVIDGKKF